MSLVLTNINILVYNFSGYYGRGSKSIQGLCNVGVHLWQNASNSFDDRYVFDMMQKNLTLF